MRPIFGFLLCVFVVGSCKENKQSKADPGLSVNRAKDSTISNERKLDTIAADTIRHIDTTFINGQQITAYCTNSYFFYVLNGKGDTLFKASDLFPDFEFSDFNSDGFDDIRVYYITNVPDIQDLVLYDPQTGRFKIVENFTDYPSPEPIKGTKYYYSYHRSGCADMNWDSDLFYIEKFKTIRIGNISGRECGNSGIKDGLYVNKVKDENEKLVATFPIKTIENYKEYKWGFIRSYWTKNYQKFL